MNHSAATLPRDERPPALFIEEPPAVASLAPSLMLAFRVVAAGEPAAALQALRRIRPALVIMNIDLTNGCGVDICREAKVLQPSARVLAVTASPEQAPSLLAAGCDGILLKPFAPNLLYARVGRVLRSGARRVIGTARCPHCGQEGGTHFEAAGRFVGWFACLRCSRVWRDRLLC